MSNFTLGVAVLFVVIAPLSVGAALFLWRLHAEDRAAHRDGPRIRLSFVLAVTGSAAAAAGTMLGVIALLVLLGYRDLARFFWPGALLAFVALDMIPVANALYLRWLRAMGR